MVLRKFRRKCYWQNQLRDLPHDFLLTNTLSWISLDIGLLTGKLPSSAVLTLASMPMIPSQLEKITKCAALTTVRSCTQDIPPHGTMVRRKHHRVIQDGGSIFLP